ncbi:preprotein translocase subunit TatC [Algimonas arctica]|uniref:Preprotein translocase subunit TatC n=1 Tax=Algimonas arctica TaxID=1479486 RepID=A0A8J3CS71_9PROT|nr:group III truncated hemoglobin [Algimonas arctica]GHA94559.1 preprotein translocase subunit TatC [Algimonas arctica]
MSAPIDEACIKTIVHAFYARVRQDPVLAPIFATKIAAEAWPQHHDHIIDFWSSIFLKTGRFTGNPMRKHVAIEGLTPAHFTRWLALFKDTADAVLLPEQSVAMHAMAQRIAQSLQMGLAFHAESGGDKNHPFVEFGLRPSKDTV